MCFRMKIGLSRGVVFHWKRFFLRILLRIVLLVNLTVYDLNFFYLKMGNRRGAEEKKLFKTVVFVKTDLHVPRENKFRNIMIRINV